jgi:nucleoside-diphosphate-sugar epimerase
MSRKRVLVTGAAGFVGAVLARRLLGDGHEVHAVVRPSGDRWRLAGIEADLRCHEIDLRDESAVAAVVNASRPELIYHLAAHGAYSSQTDVDAILHTNVLGTWSLLKALTPVDFELLVNTGSSSEYGFKDAAMREGDVLEPNSFYAVAKSSQTLLCQYVAKSRQRPIVTLRLFSAYGPYEEPSRMVPTLIRRCLEGQDLILTAPDTARDFVYIEDAVDAYLRIERLAALAGEVLNIGSGVQTTLREVVALIMQVTGAQVPCHWSAMPARIWDTQTWVADCSKSQQMLGWRATTPLADGLARTVAWMQEQRAVPRVA